MINLYPEDFLTWKREDMVVLRQITEFNRLWNEILPILGERNLNSKRIENLLSGIIRSSSPSSIETRIKSRNTRSRERIKKLGANKGKGTSYHVQLRYQLIDYFVYGSGFEVNRAYKKISLYRACRIMAKIMTVLEIQAGVNYFRVKTSKLSLQDHISNLAKSLEVDFRSDYIPGTLEGFPKGVRISSVK